MKFIDATFGRTGNRLFQLAYIYAQAREGNTPDIYLQDPKHFDKYRKELQELWKQEGEPLDFVSIHVRRGKNPSRPDEPAYSENPFYVDLCRTDYYERAATAFPGEKFLVFTDDKEWATSYHIPGVDAQVVSVSEESDFSMMARCKGHIIANSTFSWWAAYLSGNRTIAPKQWFADGINRVGFPTEWEVI